MVWLRHRVWLAGIACACAGAGITGCNSARLQCYVPPLRTWGIEVTSAGQVRWQTRLPLREGIFGKGTAPLVAGPVAVFSEDDVVYTLRRADGHRVWSWSSGRLVQGTFQWQGLVVVLTAGSRTGYLTGLDAATGKVRWTRQIGDGNPSDIAVTADGGLAVEDDGFEVVNLSDGRVRWSAPVGVATMAVSGASVLAAGSGWLTSYDDRTGKVRWTEALRPIRLAIIAGGLGPTGAAGDLGLAADAGLVYLSGVQQLPARGSYPTPVVLGISTVNGKVKWRCSPTTAVGVTVLGPGLLSVESHDRAWLEGLNPATGRPRWQLDNTGRNQMFFAGGRLIAVTSTSSTGTGGLLTAIDSADGQRVWQVRLPTVVSFPLGAVPGGLLVYASAVNNAC
jgi:outer membrane protein assembly factor BamB